MLRRALAILLAVLGPCALLDAQNRSPNVAEQYLLAAANQDREIRHLPPLRISPRLAEAARLHAYEMVRHRTISHQFSGEPDLATRAAETGAHFSLVTENVAEAPNSSEIHDLWMNSAGHRANLLDPKVDAVGIAVLEYRGEYYAVEDFAHTVQQMTIPEQEETVASLLAQAGMAISPAVEDARQTCEQSYGFSGARRPWFVMRYTSSDIHRLPEQLISKIETGRFHQAAVGACLPRKSTPFTSYSIAVLLFP